MSLSVHSASGVPLAYRQLAPIAKSVSGPEHGGVAASGSGPDADSVSISDEARAALAAETSAASEVPGDQELTQDEERMVRELSARDREVRAHEQAHKAAAGDLASGGPTYTFQTGPDGKRYAIGGEVQIQLRDGRTPEETVRNMERAQRAALAPQSPSATDRAVAAQAVQKAAQARSEAKQPEAEAALGLPGEEAEAGSGEPVDQPVNGREPTADRS